MYDFCVQVGYNYVEERKFAKEGISENRLRGGGGGPDSKPFELSIQQVVWKWNEANAWKPPEWLQGKRGYLCLKKSQTYFWHYYQTEHTGLNYSKYLYPVMQGTILLHTSSINIVVNCTAIVLKIVISHLFMSLRQSLAVQ
jgi:hypothetical protein